MRTFGGCVETRYDGEQFYYAAWCRCGYVMHPDTLDEATAFCEECARGEWPHRPAPTAAPPEPSFHRE